MKTKRLILVVLATLIALAIFVSCNSNIDSESLSFTSVSFAPSVRKALNQGGNASKLSQNVADYHWKYFVSKTKTSATTISDWKDFDDAETGLGTIKDLFKGDDYYFGLRGYTTGTSYTDDDLIWEGYHYAENSKNTEAVKLTSKKQIITIDVYTKGLGALYFNITAPLVLNQGYDSSSSSWVHPDQFYYAYELFTDNTVTGTNTLLTTFNDLTSSFDYSDPVDTPKESLSAGTYLFTIKQQTWDPEKGTTGGYVDVEERAQILIVNILAGVDTVIGGSLDSAGMVVFSYEAYSEDELKGMQLVWHTKDGEVQRLSAEAYTSDNPKEKKIINDNDRILVNDGDYVVISWVSPTDEAKLYFNGDLVSTDTDEDGYLIRAEGDESWTYIKTSGSDTLAYGKANSDYILTFQDKNQTMSFTIVGQTFEKNASRGRAKITSFASPSDVVSISVDTKSDVEISTTFTNAVAKNTLPQAAEEALASATDIDMDFVLSAYVKEKSVSHMLIETKLKAEVVLSSDSDELYNDSYEVTTLSEDVTLTFNTFKNLKGLTVKFNNSLMNQSAYEYDLETGVLLVKTNTMGNFRLDYEMPEYVVNFIDGTTVLSSQLVKYGSNATEPTLVDREKGLASYYEDSVFTTAFDFNKAIYDETSIYIKWLNSFTVTFDKNSADATYAGVTSITNIKYKAKISEPEVEPTLTNNVFYGWFKEPECRNPWKFDSDVITSDTILYAGYEPPYLTIRGTKEFKLNPGYKTGVVEPTLYYCNSDPNVPENWSQVTAGSFEQLEAAKQGDDYVLYIYGVGNTNTRISAPNYRESQWSFVASTDTDIYISGNIETLIDAPSVLNGIHPTMTDGCFEEMFYDDGNYWEGLCSPIVTAPRLPATTLSKDCYKKMFLGCSKLAVAPELPATELAEGCYASMFSGCRSLTVAPELPATKLAKLCYDYMFGYSGILKAPVLPATELADSCYSDMFYYTDIVEPPVLPATVLKPYCYDGMFWLCEKLKSVPALPATVLDECCYKDMFYGCSQLVIGTTDYNLGSVTLPANAQYVGPEGTNWGNSGSTIMFAGVDRIQLGTTYYFQPQQD